MSTPNRRASDAKASRRAGRSVKRIAVLIHAHANRIVGTLLLVLSVLCVLIAVGLILNSKADRRERASNRVEAQRTCMRTYRIGVPILNALVNGGLDPRSADIYRASIPRGRTVKEACP